MKKIIVCLGIMLLVSILPATAAEKENIPLYLGAGLGFNDDIGLDMVIGLEVNDYWDVQADFSFTDDSVVFLDGVLHLEGTDKGLYAVLGVGFADDIWLKPGLGYSIPFTSINPKASRRLFLDVEVNYYTNLDRFNDSLFTGKVLVKYRM